MMNKRDEKQPDGFSDRELMTDNSPTADDLTADLSALRVRQKRELQWGQLTLCGLCCVVMMLLNQLSARLLSGFVHDTLSYAAAVTLMSVVSVLLPSLAVMKWSGGMRRYTAPFVHKARSGVSIALVICGFGACAAVNFLMTAVNALFPAADSAGLGFAIGRSPCEVLLLLLSLAVVPAVCEETAFRGLMMGGLSSFGSGYAIVLSALCFGLLHAGARSMSAAFLTGLAMGLIRNATGSLIPPMAVHFLNNAFAVFGTLMSGTDYYEHYTVIWFVISAAAVVLMLALLGILVLRGTKLFYQYGSTVLTVREKTAAALTCPAIVLFAALSIIRLF